MQIKYILKKVASLDKIYTLQSNLGRQKIYSKKQFWWTKQIL